MQAFLVDIINPNKILLRNSYPINLSNENIHKKIPIVLKSIVNDVNNTNNLYGRVYLPYFDLIVYYRDNPKMNKAK